MKKTILMILAISLISCNQKTKNKSEETLSSQTNQETQIKTTDKNEEFKKVNADEFNQLLSKKEGDLSAKEVMKLFYPNEVETEEGNEQITTSEKTAENGNTIVTLIHENQLDDSLNGMKYIMELQKSNDKWIVVSIKKNWKCWNGRGHTDWGIELCK